MTLNFIIKNWFKEEWWEEMLGQGGQLWSITWRNGLFKERVLLSCVFRAYIISKTILRNFLWKNENIKLFQFLIKTFLKWIINVCHTLTRTFRRGRHGALSAPTWFCPCSWSPVKETKILIEQMEKAWNWFSSAPKSSFGTYYFKAYSYANKLSELNDALKSSSGWFDRTKCKD